MEDFFRATGCVWKTTLKSVLTVLTRHELLYLFVYRKIQQSKSHLGVWRVIRWRLRRRYGLEIESFDIGPGFRMVHPYNITISPLACIGRNCTIHKGATVGKESRGVRQGAPIIGDCVWIGINAVIVGRITIGNNVLIAPNAYVNQNIPENSIVIGCPARVFPDRPEATKEYL